MKSKAPNADSTPHQRSSKQNTVRCKGRLNLWTRCEHDSVARLLHCLFRLARISVESSSVIPESVQLSSWINPSRKHQERPLYDQSHLQGGHQIFHTLRPSKLRLRGANLWKAIGAGRMTFRLGVFFPASSSLLRFGRLRLSTSMSVDKTST